MKKKNYHSPSMQVIELLSSQLLSGSNQGGDGPVHAPRFNNDTYDYGE